MFLCPARLCSLVGSQTLDFAPAPLSVGAGETGPRSGCPVEQTQKTQGTGDMVDKIDCMTEVWTQVTNLTRLDLTK